ncbi:MAG TPA: hypothetical protein VK172_12070 [Lentimicrobium sp.]|nr:hypothetical protein [Lentimicrobium sp.]
MRLSTLLLLIVILVFTFGCDEKKQDDNIPVVTNPYLGVWEYDYSPTITLKCEFTDSLLIMTRIDPNGVS